MFDGVVGAWNIPREPKLREYGGGKSNWCSGLSIKGFCGVDDVSDVEGGDDMAEARLLLVTERSLRRNFARRFWNLIIEMF